MVSIVMALPRFIPKVVFQLIAVVSLLGVLTASVQLCLAELPPYLWLTGLGEAVAGVSTLALGVLLWGVLVLPVRLMSHMPTLAEELAEAGAADLGELYAQQQRQLRKDEQRDNARWHGMMALAGGLVAGVMGLVVANFWFFEGVVLGGMAIVAVVIGALGVWHLALCLLRLARPRAS